MPSPTYTKAQADKLLGRAARLQTDADLAGAEPTLSLEDIKEAAATAGIDPAYVELALHMPPTTEVAVPPPYAMMPVGVARTRIVRGRMDAATWKRIVADLRRTLGGQGRVEAEPGLYGWHRAPLHITAEAHGDFVQLIASARWDGEVRAFTAIAATMAFTTLIMGVTLLQNSGGSSLTVAAFALAVLAFAGWLGLRYRSKETRVGQKFDAALDRIEAALAQTQPALAAVPAPMPDIVRSGPAAVRPLLDTPTEVSPEVAGLSNPRARTRA